MADVTRPLLADVLDARKYDVARINDYTTSEVAAQALAQEFDRVRKQGEELATEALLDAYDRGHKTASLRYRAALQRAFEDMHRTREEVHVAQMRILHALDPDRHGPVPEPDWTQIRLVRHDSFGEIAIGAARWAFDLEQWERAACFITQVRRLWHMRAVWSDEVERAAAADKVPPTPWPGASPNKRNDDECTCADDATALCPVHHGYAR